MSAGALLLIVVGVALVYLAATNKLLPVWGLLQDAWTRQPAGTHERIGQ